MENVFCKTCGKKQGFPSFTHRVLCTQCVFCKSLLPRLNNFGFEVTRDLIKFVDTKNKDLCTSLTIHPFTCKEEVCGKLLPCSEHFDQENYSCIKSADLTIQEHLEVEEKIERRRQYYSSLESYDQQLMNRKNNDLILSEMFPLIKDCVMSLQEDDGKVDFTQALNELELATGKSFKYNLVRLKEMVNEVANFLLDRNESLCFIICGAVSEDDTFSIQSTRDITGHLRKTSLCIGKRVSTRGKFLRFRYEVEGTLGEVTLPMQNGCLQQNFHIRSEGVRIIQCIFKHPTDWLNKVDITEKLQGLVHSHGCLRITPEQELINLFGDPAPQVEKRLILDVSLPQYRQRESYMVVHAHLTERLLISGPIIQPGRYKTLRIVSASLISNRDILDVTADMENKMENNRLCITVEEDLFELCRSAYPEVLSDDVEIELRIEYERLDLKKRLVTKTNNKGQVEEEVLVGFTDTDQVKMSVVQIQQQEVE
eukprot:snap_masked-scaffold_1-processed-gene-20.48-mRNA-1 protein AED:1.00 eAED:1.00 QI:0/-1/0/0/-1/1/1/0/481